MKKEIKDLKGDIDKFVTILEVLTCSSHQENSKTNTVKGKEYLNDTINILDLIDIHRKQYPSA